MPFIVATTSKRAALFFYADCHSTFVKIEPSANLEMSLSITGVHPIGLEQLSKLIWILGNGIGHAQCSPSPDHSAYRSHQSLSLSSSLHYLLEASHENISTQSALAYF